MKRILTLLFVVTAVQVNAQTLLIDNFNYPASDTLKGYGGWFRYGSSANDVKVKAPGLTYAGYGGSGIGNAVWFNNKANGNLYSINLVKMDTGTVYVSYLMNVDSMSASALEGYNVAMDQYGGATNVNLHANIQRVTDSTYKIGITKTQVLSYINKLYNTKKTYLVVLKYTFVPGGTTNDSAKVFVFSSGVPSVEPAVPDTFIVTGNDAADMGEIWLTNSYGQSGLLGSSVTVDGLKVGRAWSNSVLAAVSRNRNGTGPADFSLQQNYPNPFNPTTMINYHLPAGQAGLAMNNRVTLKVYDVLGREAAILVNEVKATGNYSVPFNGSKLSSGIYFYRLQSGEFSAVKKMQLIK